jgi:SSS family solute:Na+ symporter
VHARFPGLSPEAALPTALTTIAPQGLRGLIVVGLLGAVMSSADTTLISASTILSLNVVGPLTSLDDAGKLRLTRVFVVVVGGVAWCIAAFQEGIIASLLLAYTVFVGGVALPTLASFWRDRLKVTSTGALWAVLVGGGTAVLIEVTGGTLGSEVSRIFPVVISGMTLVLVSRISGFTRVRNPEG